jgi:hypothetical protein
MRGRPYWELYAEKNGGEDSGSESREDVAHDALLGLLRCKIYRRSGYKNFLYYTIKFIKSKSPISRRFI